MAKKEQELLEMLYKASLEERDALRNIPDIRSAEKKRRALELNESDRREHVDALMQAILIKNKRNYFHAAMIYSHGKALADYTKTIHYAEQAFNLNDGVVFLKKELRQLKAVYEQAYDRKQVALGKSPIYRIKTNLDSSREEQSLLRAGRTPTPKPSFTRLLDDQKKRKEAEEAYQASRISCSNCNGRGHSSISCMKPKKKG
jgi:hypothetical protein